MSTQQPDPYGMDGPIESIGVTKPTGNSPAPEPGHTTTESTRLDAKAVEPGRKCIACGYDLVGLYVGGNCPECGDKILSIAPRAEIDAFKRLPHWYLRLLSIALGLMAVLIVAAFAYPIFGVLNGFNSTPSLKTVFALYEPMPFVWLACVVFVCVPPPEREPALGIGRSRREVWVSALAILSQSGFAISMLYPIYVGLTNGALRMFWLVTPGVISFVLVSVVALQIANIASRFNDEDRARRLRFAAVAILIGDVTMLMLPQPLSLVILGWGYIYLIWSLLSLSSEAGWAVRNSVRKQERIDRLKQRASEEFEQAQREREADAPFGGPIP